MNELIAVSPRRKPWGREVVLAIITWIAADSLAAIVIFGVCAVEVARSGKSLSEAVKQLPHDPVFTTITGLVGAFIAITVVLRFVRRVRAKAEHDR